MALSVPTAVDFHGAHLPVVEIDGAPYVALKPICEALSVDWPAQRRRVMRNPVLSEGVAITVMPTAGGDQEAVCLTLSKLNGWLFGISTARVRDPARRERLLQYQRECFDVLSAHFMNKSATSRRQESAGSYAIDSDGQIGKALELAALAACVAQPAIFKALLGSPRGTDAGATLLATIGHDGAAHCLLVERGSFVTSLDVLPSMLAADDAVGATDEQLLAIANAALARLAQRRGLPPPKTGCFRGQPPQGSATLAMRGR